jgi:hypothetical protein
MDILRGVFGLPADCNVAPGLVGPVVVRIKFPTEPGTIMDTPEWDLDRKWVRRVDGLQKA